jgi:hypothetical protein
VNDKSAKLSLGLKFVKLAGCIAIAALSVAEMFDSYRLGKGSEQRLDLEFGFAITMVV